MHAWFFAYNICMSFYTQVILTLSCIVYTLYLYLIFEATSNQEYCISCLTSDFINC